MGGGSPSPATYSVGGNPAAYVPQGQAGADVNYQNIIASMIGGGGYGLPGLGASPANIFYPWAEREIATLAQPGPAGQTAGSFGAYGSTALDAAMQAYQGYAGNAYPGLTQYGPQLGGAAQQVLGTAFDPQSQLYNQLQRQQVDQSQAAAAQSGLSGSPYAAGLQTEALQNLATNWQNQQLQRQAQGTQAAGSVLPAAAGLTSLPYQQLAQFGALPYQTAAQQAQNALAATGQAPGWGAGRGAG